MVTATPESLRVDFERACLALPAHERPNLERLDSGEYRLSKTRERFAGWCMHHAHYCEGEA